MYTSLQHTTVNLLHEIQLLTTSMSLPNAFSSSCFRARN